MIETGKRAATPEVIAKLAPVLQMPTDELQAWADADRIGEERLENAAYAWGLINPTYQWTPELGDMIRRLREEVGMTQSLL